VLVLCGGVSVGRHDHVRPSLAELGAEQRFWGLALKPGHPTWFGTLEQTLVFGLPGNPVSAMVTFVLLVEPALRAMQGAQAAACSTTAALDGGYRKPAGRAHAVRCRVRLRDDGWHARPTGAQGSHMLSSMLAADALAIVPSEVTEIGDGGLVRIEPLRELGAPA
jgi:molybdopterin molybdotransferase